VAAIDIELSGPIFSGAADVAVMDMAVDAVESVAAFALERVQFNLDASIRVPTPYYETQIAMFAPAIFDRTVSDRGVIYGPWLEGTSSRNRTTRFRGYASFRRAHQATEAAVPAILDRVAARAAPRMGG
jgi:hypothetical protein